uniref:Cyclin-dependent kinase inhibitor domain-containing protein n=1 Tax=Meloidogyne incognita TaxID=6306 RepID=A0A914MBC4_MELIC
MQLKILSPSIYHQLVPNSTRPIWHQWHINNEDKNNKENLEENNENFNKRSSTARRRLFFEEGGEGNNKEINKQFVQNWLNELSEHYKQKWGFDFDECKPLEKSRFEFERVPADQVPGFYRTTKTFKYKNNEGKECFRGKNKTELNNNCCSQNNSGELTTTCLANSPIRSSLRKPPFHLNSVRTPTRRRLSLNISNNNNSCSSSEKQTKITDFVSVRKSFSPPDSLKFGKMGEENGKQNGKLLESPKKRRLNSKTEKGKKRVKIDLNEGIASRRSLRLRHLYAQNTTI